MSSPTNKLIRTFLLFATSGLFWYVMMRLCFVWSGAQQILGNPQFQSDKFIKAFTAYEPLPRMALDASIVPKGFFICGLFLSVAFLIVNHLLKGGWLKRGLLFGFCHWLLMTPWFEFYLPYNVMHEPLLLVLLEGVLWLVTCLLTAVYLSLVVNYKAVGH